MAAPRGETRGIRLRPFQQGDEEKVLVLWQRSLPTDPVPREGVVALLETMGFQPLEEPVAMDMTLVGFAVPDDVLRLRDERAREGYTIDVLEHRYIADVLQFNYRQFGADWSRAVRDALLRGVSTDHVLIARHGDEIVGFCLYGGYDHAAERFGPFGVRADLRGIGLGKLLLYDCLQHMQGSGLHNAY